MANEVSYKPSLNIESFFGDEFSEENERFLLFLKAYYEWLQTTSIVIVNKTGTFQRNEVITGATSRATATIKEVKDGELIVQVNTKKPFSKNETITGQTSGATATIYSTKDNVVRSSGNIVDYRTLDNSIDKYFEYLKDELYTSLPVNFYGNKPLIASKFKDFFTSKSNEQSYRFLFRLLYNEEIDFYYPGDDIIRSSDGNYEQTQVIRTTSSAFGTDSEGNTYTRNIFDFLNKTIRGKTSGALAFVVDIKKFFIGSIETAELTLKLVSADFQEGEEIVDIDDDDLNATVYGIISGFTINDGGSGYQVGDSIVISGDGSEAQARVSSIKQSPITSLKVNTVGHGYRVGTTASIDNSGTGGSGLIVRVTELANTYTVTNANTGNTYTVGEISEVSVINRGSDYFAAPSITLIDTVIESMGMLSSKLVTITNPGTNYHVGDSLVITANTGANAVGQVASVTANASFSNSLIFEDGVNILFEQSYDDVLKDEDWNLGSYGPIRRIEFTNFGNGYSADYPPTITVSTSSGANAQLTVIGIQGMNANVEVDTANNITGIGSIRAVEITNFGIDYTTATANAAASGDGNANLTPLISGIGTNVGKWLNDDGKIDYKILQDSYYFQDYSYVIKSGLTVEKYIDTIKRSIHPAGLQVFGELLLIDTIEVTPIFKSSIETIKDFIVRIYDFVTVTPQFNEFSISIETTIESFIPLQVGLLPNTDVATHEYVIQVVAGGDDITNVMDTNVSSLREIKVIVASELNTEMEVEVPPIRKLLVSYTNIFDAYSRTEYGDLLLSEYGDVKISEFASFSFDDLFGAPLPYKFGEYVVKLVPGGGDTTYVEDLSVQSSSKLVYLIESFWTSAATVLISDVQVMHTGTREVVIDIFTALNTEASAEIEIAPKYNLGPLEVTITSSQEYSVIVESLGLANAEFTMIIAFSSVTPQKLQTAENLVLAYGTTFEDMSISEIADQTFNSYIPEGEFVYQIKDRLLSSVYRTSPRNFREIVVTYQNVDNAVIDVPSREVVVQLQPGHDFGLWADNRISEYANVAISTLADEFVGGLDEFISRGTSIKVSPSQWTNGQNPDRVESTDVFFKEYQAEISLEKFTGYKFQDLFISALDNFAISLFQNQTLQDEYDTIPTKLVVNKYEKIAGTVSSAVETYGDIAVSPYANTLLSVIDQLTLSANASIVVGNSTTFTSDFAANDEFVANNELFAVEAIANNEYMILDRFPSSPYSNIFAYKQI